MEAGKQLGIARNGSSEEEAGMLRPRNLPGSGGRALRTGEQQVQRPWGRKQLGELQEQKEAQWEQILGSELLLFRAKREPTGIPGLHHSNGLPPLPQSIHLSCVPL